VNGAGRELQIRRLVWLLPAAFALHELEEWNIVPWFRENFSPQTELTDLGARTLLAAFSLGAFLFTGFAALLPTIRMTLCAVLPLFIVIGVGNALTHVFWLLYFGSYAPGVATAALLVAPVTIYISQRAVWENHVSRWLVGVLYLLALVPLIAVTRAGNTLTPEQLALHRLGAQLAGWLWVR
jgi:hypothetical protein